MWAKVYNNDEAVYDFLIQWKAQVGPSRGRGAQRLGKFDWIRYKAKFYRKAGQRRTSGTEQCTLKEFTDRMVAKGKDSQWAVQEWHRRRNTDEEEEGNDNMVVVGGGYLVAPRHGERERCVCVIFQ